MSTHGSIKINLEELIKKSNMSKNKFCHLAQMERTQVNKYCKNIIGRVDLDVVCRICNTLNCQVGDLLEFIPPKEN